MVAIVYSTIDDIKDARKIAHILVEEQIVACVNIISSAESVYKWKAEVKHEDECILLAKTVDSNVKKTIQRIKQLHPYEIPCIIVLPIIGGVKDYLDYIHRETS
ncbi:MAG: divalent-cation tolerance protein CutA [Thermoplasmatota archaeon]